MRAWPSCVLGAVLTSCQGLEVSGSVGGDESVWGFLESKYDEDADGRVGREEYPRSDRTFARLDRDRDGFLAQADFEETEEPPWSPDVARKLRAELAFYFQTDRDPLRFAMVELDDSMSTYDTDGDGVLVRAEFMEATLRRLAHGKLAQHRAAWDHLVEHLDIDADRALDKGEVFRFYFVDGDRQLVIDLGAEGEPTAEPASTKPTGPPVGTLAPDFTLATPDGKTSYTLSSFRGDRPVALIFGSYT